MHGFVAGQLPWTQVNTNGFGDARNRSVLSGAVYNGNLYVGTFNRTAGTEVWKYNGTTWTQVNANGFGDANNWNSCMAVYNGSLYGGTLNQLTGTEIWETQLQPPRALSSSEVTCTPSRIPETLADAREH
jgi:outer membrane protein assembly factor BamB